LDLTPQQIRQVKHPNALFYELTVQPGQIEVRHYLADMHRDGLSFSHSGQAIDGICEQLPPQAISGE
jgi:hypothetical protein